MKLSHRAQRMKPSATLAITAQAKQMRAEGIAALHTGATASFDVARFLLQEAQVAVVPGAPFGADTNMRLSYAAATEAIEQGPERIRRAVSGLRRP